MIDKDLVIDASSLCDSGHATIGITISGAGQSRVFKIAGAVGEDPITVELLALVTDGYVNGGLNDAFGGGLFVSNADLTLTDVKS